MNEYEKQIEAERAYFADGARKNSQLLRKLEARKSETSKTEAAIGGCSPATLLADNIRTLYTVSRKCVCEDEPDAHSVVLLVGNQSFVIGALPCETFQEAQWMREMLSQAIATIVREMSAIGTHAASLISRLSLSSMVLKPFCGCAARILKPANTSYTHTLQ